MTKKIISLISILGVLVFFTPFSTAYAAGITFDAAATGGTNTSSSISYTHTMGAGCSNNIVIVTVSANTGDIAGFPSTITYGGNNMTQLFSVNQTGGKGYIGYYLTGQASGANTVSITFANILTYSSTAVSYCGVKQVNPFRTVADTTGVSISNTTVANDMVLGLLDMSDNGGCGGAYSAPTSITSQTNRAFLSNSNGGFCSSSTHADVIATTTTTVVGFTGTSGSVNVIVNVPMIPAGGGFNFWQFFDF